MIAYNLLKAQPEAQILMLEARDLCSGATGRNGGHTKAASYRSYLRNVEELGKEEALRIVRLEWGNIVETHGLASELGIECEGAMCRTVDVIYDREVFEAGSRAIRVLRADVRDEEKEEGGMAWYEIYEDVETVREKFGVAGENANLAVGQEEEEVVGAFEYMAGRIHAYRFTTGILSACTSRGLQIRTNSPVSSITPSNPHTNTPFQVHTHHSTYSTRNVILATNGYTPFLAPKFQTAIIPMRGQITVQKPGSATTLPSPLPSTFSFIYKSGYEYMIPRPLVDGSQHVVIGGGLGRLPDAGASEFGTVDDGSLNASISTYLHGSLAGYFGKVNWGESSAADAKGRVVQEWSGIMGATADGRPFVGELLGDGEQVGDDAQGEGGMWVSAGFNGHGMVLCLKSAEALVEMMGKRGRGEGLEWFPRSFLPGEGRFGKGRFRGRRDLVAEE
jgi:glycine/D-amino acid oxidase-like deaminating enzyme